MNVSGLNTSIEQAEGGAAVKILTEDMKELTGGQVIINPDAKESADILEKIILEKRDALHI